MRLLRTMMALVIALSVAMLPAAGAAVSIAKSSPQAATEMMAEDMTMSSDMPSAMDCCPDSAKDKRCDHPNGQCPMAFCAAQSINLALATAFRFDFPLVAGNPLPIPVDQVVTLRGSSPPFRPPRV